MRKFVVSVLVLCMAFTVEAPLAFAVGSGAFENAAFTAKFAAEGNAGVADASEPGAISYNPAGIIQLDGFQSQQSFIFVNSWTGINSDGGPDTSSSGTTAFIPPGYVTFKPRKLFGDRVVFGVGSDSPFGLSKKYDSTHPATRYTGHKGHIKMFTIKPTVAVKLHDTFTVGGGPVYNRIFDFQTIAQYPNQLLQRTGVIPGPPILNFFDDGQVRFNFNGYAWSWQLGALFKPNKKHSFGMYFRSPIDIRTKGKIKVENSQFGGDFETKGSAELNLPLNFTWGYKYSPDEKTNYMVDFGYTRWSTLERIVINHEPVGRASDDGILAAVGRRNLDYKSAYSLHFGANRKVHDKLTLRGGALFYWTPVPEENFAPIIPDSNRLAFTFGASYHVNPNLSLDFSYAGLINLSRNIDNDVSEILGVTVDGNYKTYTQAITMTVTMKSDLFGLMPFDEPTPEHYEDNLYVMQNENG